MSDKYYRNKEWDVPALVSKGKFTVGSVIRVSMKNFLTFDECEVFPGPRLNVVLGPNGTGKSSVTHAICLACGGAPKTVGRSPDMRTFVKQGKEGQQAYAEVDLLRSPTAAVTVRRQIDAETKSSKWFVNGTASTEKAVKDIMRELKIDVDNLCSFMPQDRVGEFSRNTPKETLQKTLQSIPDPNDSGQTLAFEQQQLADIEKSKSTQEKEAAAKRSAYDTMSQQMANMKAEVERMQARRVAIEQHGLCEVKYKVQLAKDGHAKVMVLEADLKKAKDALQAAEDAIKPLENHKRVLEQQQSRHDRAYDNAKNGYDKAVRDLGRAKEGLDTSEMETEALKTELEHFDRIRSTHEKDLKKFDKDIADTQKKIDDMKENLEKAQERMDQVSREIKELNEKENALADEEGVLQRQRQEADHHKATIKAEINGQKDPFNVFKERLGYMVRNEQKLRQDVTDSLALRSWLDGEQAAGRYRSVIGPIATLITVKDPAVAYMVEGAVGGVKALLGYIATNEREGRALREQVRRMNWFVDVDTMTNNTLEPPIVPRAYLDQFKNVGMQGYLGEQVECGDTVRAWLYQWKYLHLAMWARAGPTTARITEDHYKLLIPDQYNASQFRLYVHETAAAASSGARGPGGGNVVVTTYVGKLSRFARTGKPSTSSQTNSGRAAVLSSDGGEDVEARKAELKQQLTAAEAAADDAKRAHTAKADERNAVQSEKRRLANMKTECQKFLATPKQLADVIGSLKRAREAKKRDLDKYGENARAGKRKEFEKKLDEYLKRFDAAMALARRVLALQVETAAASHATKGLEAAIEDAAKAVSDAREGLKEFKVAEKEAKEKRDTFKREADKAESEIEALKARFGGERAFIARIKEANAAFPETDVEVLFERMAQLKTEIDNSVDNPEVIKRYEELVEEAARAKQELDVVEDRLQNFEAKNRERIEAWKENALMVTGKLHDSFKKFMEALQYHGEVKMVETGAISEYEMQLMVSFRDTEGMRQLSGTRHSGGERAVSTVMYLMALQEMTSAPFRVVDEINQGMDERNERLVFDRIVQSCCSAKDAAALARANPLVSQTKPQYFLVSPKLLQGLRAMDHDDVTVLLVLNGPGVKSKWQLRDVLQSMMRAANGGRGVVEDEEEEDDEDEAAEVVPRGKENNSSSSSSSSSSAVGKRGAAAAAPPASAAKKKQKT